MIKKYYYQKKPYHFESSDKFYCDFDSINSAYKLTLNKKVWKDIDIRQLEMIIKLEILRNRLGNNEVDLMSYRSQMQQIVYEYAQNDKQNVFEETEIHDTFYDFLNMVVRKEEKRMNNRVVQAITGALISALAGTKVGTFIADYQERQQRKLVDEVINKSIQVRIIKGKK